jgi:hypothetical protein
MRSRSKYELQTQTANHPEAQLEDTVSKLSEPFCAISLLLYSDLQPFYALPDVSFWKVVFRECGSNGV